MWKDKIEPYANQPIYTKLYYEVDGMMLRVPSKEVMPEGALIQEVKMMHGYLADPPRVIREDWACYLTLCMQHGPVAN